MKKQLLAILLASLGTIGSAQAALQTYSGSHFDFLWDDTGWEGLTPTVSGNTITFADPLGLGLASTQTGRGNRTYSSAWFSFQLSFDVIGKAGYQLAGLTVSNQANGSIGANTGSGYVSHNASTYTQDSMMVGNYSYADGQVAEGQSFSGSLNNSHSLTFASVNKLGFSYWSSGNVSLSSAGVRGVPGEIAQTGVSFEVIPAVPEPETYGMLLAGAGILGAILRRRRIV